MTEIHERNMMIPVKTARSVQLIVVAKKVLFEMFICDRGNTSNSKKTMSEYN